MNFRLIVGTATSPGRIEFTGDPHASRITLADQEPGTRIVFQDSEGQTVLTLRFPRQEVTIGKRS